MTVAVCIKILEKNQVILGDRAG